MKSNKNKKSRYSMLITDKTYRSLFETMYLGVVFLDETGVIITANPAAESIFGLTLEEFQGKTMYNPEWKAVCEDGSEMPRDDYPAHVALRTGKVVKDVTMGVFNPKKKRISWILVNAVPLFNSNSRKPYQVYTTIRDITEQKEAEASLIKSESRLNLALDATSEGVWDWNITDNTTYFSPRYYKMLGYEPYEFPQTYESWAGLVHPDDLKRTEKFINKHHEAKSSRYEVEFRLREKSGAYRWILGRGRVVKRDKHGNAVRMIGTHMDITERKAMEIALLSEKIKLEHKVDFELLLNNITSLSNSTNAFGKITNKALCMIREALNIDNVSLLEIDRQRKFIKRISESSLEGMTPRIKSVLKVQFKSIPEELMTVITEGSRLTASSIENLGPDSYKFLKNRNIWSFAIIPLKLGKKVKGVITFTNNYPFLWNDEFLDHLQTIADIIANAWARNINFKEKINSEKKRQQALSLLEKASRLVSIGTLAAGTVHEINQPLNALKITVDGMLYWNKHNQKVESDEILEGFELISKQVSRIEEIIRQLRVLAKNEENINFGKIDVNNVIRKSLSLVQQQLNAHGIKLIFDLDKKSPMIKWNSIQLQQVIINLIMNAMQALDRFIQDEKTITVKSRKTSGKVNIEIIDNGPGIPESVLDKIFDPFFTTRSQDGGMGFGLSIVHDIITKIHGKITVENIPDCGTLFHIEIPLKQKV